MTSLGILSNLYYVLTGYQTLGEEYVSVIQVDPTKRRIPSRARRLALVVVHTFVPYVLDKLLVCIEHELEVEEWDSRIAQRDTALTWSPMSYLKAWIQTAMRMLNGQQRKALKPVVFAVQQGITILHRVHVAWFYISGAFYHLAKRASGISYVSKACPLVIKPIDHALFVNNMHSTAREMLRKWFGSYGDYEPCNAVIKVWKGFIVGQYLYIKVVFQVQEQPSGEIL